MKCALSQGHACDEALARHHLNLSIPTTHQPHISAQKQ